MAYLSHLLNISHYLNQVARRVNETGSVYVADVEDLRVQYDGLWAQAREILTKLAAL